jgi:hypothetical protein
LQNNSSNRSPNQALEHLDLGLGHRHFLRPSILHVLGHESVQPDPRVSRRDLARRRLCYLDLAGENASHGLHIGDRVLLKHALDGRRAVALPVLIEIVDKIVGELVARALGATGGIAGLARPEARIADQVLGVCHRVAFKGEISMLPRQLDAWRICPSYL